MLLRMIPPRCHTGGCSAVAAIISATSCGLLAQGWKIRVEHIADDEFIFIESTLYSTACLVFSLHVYFLSLCACMIEWFGSGTNEERRAWMQIIVVAHMGVQWSHKRVPLVNVNLVMISDITLEHWFDQGSLGDLCFPATPARTALQRIWSTRNIWFW